MSLLAGLLTLMLVGGHPDRDGSITRAVDAIRPASAERVPAIVCRGDDQDGEEPAPPHAADGESDQLVTVGVYFFVKLGNIGWGSGGQGTRADPLWIQVPINTLVGMRVSLIMPAKHAKKPADEKS
jgi:hypothetical protein